MDRMRRRDRWVIGILVTIKLQNRLVARVYPPTPNPNGNVIAAVGHGSQRRDLARRLEHFGYHITRETLRTALTRP